MLAKPTPPLQSSNIIKSVDWLKENLTGDQHFHHHIWGFHADLPLIQSRDQMHTLDDRHTGISEAPIPALPFLMQLLTNMHIEKLCKLKSAIIKASCLGVMIFIWPLPGPHTSIPEVWPGTPFLGDDLISGILHDLSTRQKYVPENSKKIKVDPVLNYKLNSHVY